MSAKIPAVGDEVYIPTLGEYFVGGLAEVGCVLSFEDNTHHLLFKGLSLNVRWENGIEPLQEELKKQFGSQRAHGTGVVPPCPL